MKRAVALVGDDPVIYEHLGEIHLKQQHLSDGREALLHALELDPRMTSSCSGFVTRFWAILPRRTNSAKPSDVRDRAEDGSPAQ